MTAAPSYETCLAALTGERPRVWSLIVTIFGDLAFRQGDRVSTQVLARITEPIGIKPEALRVALHRLRKDGWIDSERVGRSSSYRLTAHGLQQTQAAAPRIYARTDPAAQDWAVIMAHAADAASQAALDTLAAGHHMVRLSTTTLLGPRPQGSTDANLLFGVVNVGSVPEWLQNMACPPDVCAAYSDLLQLLRQTGSVLPQGQPPLQTTILRCLIVHSWRRVLLRHPDLPDSFFPQDCPAVACRDLTMQLLTRLPRPALSDL